jgi:hypothetical protein
MDDLTYHVSCNVPGAEITIEPDTDNAIHYRVYYKGPLPWWKRAWWWLLRRT